MCKVRYSSIAQLHEGLDKVSLGCAILTVDDLQYFTGSHEVVAGIRVGFVTGSSRIRVSVMVEEILLNQNTQAVPKMPWSE